MEKPRALNDLPPEPLTLSVIVENTKTNYLTAYMNRIQLEELQSWIRQQLKLNAK